MIPAVLSDDFLHTSHHVVVYLVESKKQNVYVE